MIAKHPRDYALVQPKTSGLRESLGSGPDLVSEPEEVIAALIRLANDDVKIEASSRVFRHEDTWRVVGYECTFESRESALREAENEVEDECALAYEILDTAAEGRAALFDLLRPKPSWPDDPDETNVVMRPRLEFLKSGEARMTWRITGPAGDSIPWTLFGAYHLLVTAIEDQTYIGKCHLESCGRFFMIEKGNIGRPQTRYCCEDHRLERHRIEATERKRRSRAAKKAQIRKPRRAK